MSSRAFIEAPSQDMRFFSSIGCRTYVVAGEVVDGGLAEHGVVLELRLAERRGVAGNDDELGLAGAEGLEGGLVTKSDLAGLFLDVLAVMFGAWCWNRARNAHLDSQRQLGVDAVSGLCALLRCHFIGIWRGSWAVVEVVVGRLAAEVGGSRIRLVRVCKSWSPARVRAERAERCRACWKMHG
jgi:hypothetical protein